MDKTVTLRYDDAIVKSALRGYVARYLGWKFRLFAAVIAVGFTVLAVRGTWQWYTPFLAAILAICVLVPLVIYGIMLPMLTRRFRTLYGDEAQFRFSDSELGVTTAHHSGRTPWKGFQRLWRLPGVWLLFTGKDSFTLLPTADLPHDIQQHIVDKIERNGGEVS